VRFVVTEHNQVTVTAANVHRQQHVSSDELRSVMFTAHQRLRVGSGDRSARTTFEREIAVISSSI